MSVNIYAMTDTWNAIGTTFDSILMDVSNGAAGNPVGAAASQLFNLKTNGTQRLGVRSPHFANGTDTTPFLNLVDIWNTNGAVSGIKYNVTDTASAAGSLLLDLQTGSSTRFNVRKDGTVSISNGTTTLAIDSNDVTADRSGAFYVYNKNASGTLALGTTNSVYGLTIDNAGTTGFFNAAGTSYLRADAANTLALQNGTSAQQFRVYGTSSSANANFERVEVGYNSSLGIYGVLTNQGGTGTSQALYLGTVGSNNVAILTNSTTRWIVNSSGSFLAATDNSWDIGASGANRPRNVYVANNITTGGGLTGASQINTGAGGYIQWTNRSSMSSPADGQLTLQNWAGTDFGRIQLGGSTASFPAIKRSTTSLQVRLADDSAFTAIQGKLTTDTAYTATPQTCSGYITIYDSTGTPYKVMVST